MRETTRLAACAALLATLSACGGGSDNASRSLATSSDSGTAGSSNGISSGTSISNHGFSGSASANPLNLDPAPLFTPSARSVTYGDCFPKHDDVLVSDVATDRIETYSSTTGISTVDQTNTVTSVAPASFNGRNGVSVTMDNPPHTGQDNSLLFGVESKQLLLQGMAFTTFTKNYLNDSTGTRSTFMSTPSSLGDLSAGHTLISYGLGDSVTNKFSTSYFDMLSPQFNTQVDITEKITFIGVEEGTTVAAGKFDYTCVFRRELTSTVNGQPYTSVEDVYSHKWSGVKTVSFGSSYPRPLVSQLVSSSALTRRIAASQ